MWVTVACFSSASFVSPLEAFVGFMWGGFVEKSTGE